jgi:hypothetical protein
MRRLKPILSAVYAATMVLGIAAARHESVAQGSATTEEIRKELLEARSTAWRAFFQKDLSVLEQILAPELIAIQEQVERWDNRASLLKMAQSMKERGVQLTRLEFPRTEIQLFGNTAILYYTYVMEQRLGDSTRARFSARTEHGSGSARRFPSPVQCLPHRSSDRPASLAGITDLSYNIVDKVALWRFINWIL